MIKLHLGSGNIRIPGYLNIDKDESYNEVDHIHDLETPLPFEDETVNEIVGFHVFEHLDPEVISEVVRSWYNCLVKGGHLILEMPDFAKIIKLYTEGQEDFALSQIFGDKDTRSKAPHKWGWTKTRLEALLQAAGFSKIEFTEPQDYHAKNLNYPCLRVEASK